MKARPTKENKKKENQSARRRKAKPRSRRAAALRVEPADEAYELPYRVQLRAGRDKAARNRHPWVYSGAIEVVKGSGPPGALGDLHDHRGRFVARGFVNTTSKIVLRETACLIASFTAT